MLGLAIAGLFLRLPDSRRVNQAVSVAFPLAALLMGMLLVGGVDVAEGIVLGVTAFAAQMLWPTMRPTGRSTRGRRGHLLENQRRFLTGTTRATVTPERRSTVPDSTAASARSTSPSITNGTGPATSTTTAAACSLTAA
jgi:hypothetical protein